MSKKNTLFILIKDEKGFKKPLVIVKDCDYTVDVTSDFRDVTMMTGVGAWVREGTTVTIRMTEEGPLKP